jgi:hypothetical protein
VLLRGLLSGLLTFGIASAVLGVLYWRSLDPLMVTAASVAPAQPLNGSCDLTVDVVGTVETNGRGGTVTYQWIRSERAESAPASATVVECQAAGGTKRRRCRSTSTGWYGHSTRQ